MEGSPCEVLRRRFKEGPVLLVESFGDVKEVDLRRLQRAVLYAVDLLFFLRSCRRFLLNAWLLRELITASLHTWGHEYVCSGPNCCGCGIDACGSLIGRLATGPI